MKRECLPVSTQRGPSPGSVPSLRMNLAGPELLILLVVIVLLFGATKLPKLARSLGEAQNQFKAGQNERTTHPDDDQEPPS